jgi:CRP-like cAMP-binding protein
MIPSKTLEQYGGKLIVYEKGHVLFSEGDSAHFFFQLESGLIKMSQFTKEGNEFIQGIFSDSESFGEPPLFCDFGYPSYATTLCKSKIWRLQKEQFMNLLQENFQLHLALDKAICERIKYKSSLARELSHANPEHRIFELLNHIKQKKIKTQLNSSIEGDNTFVVPLTRQQIADMTGLRVETVIRTIIKMQEQGKLTLVNHKICI